MRFTAFYFSDESSQTQAGRQARADDESGLGTQAPPCLNITLAHGMWRGKEGSPRLPVDHPEMLTISVAYPPFQVGRHDPRRLVELHAQRRDHHRSRQALRQRTEIARGEIARLERRATEIQDVVPGVCGRADEGLAEYEWEGAGAGGTAGRGEGAARGQSFLCSFFFFSFPFACFHGAETDVLLSLVHSSAEQLVNTSDERDATLAAFRASPQDERDVNPRQSRREWLTQLATGRSVLALALFVAVCAVSLRHFV